MPDLMPIIMAVPFLFGLSMRRGRGPGPDTYASGLAALGLVPAAYLLIRPQLPGGSGCAGGTCVADGILVFPALGLGLFSLGFLAGGLLVRVTQTSPRVEAGANALGKLLRTVLVGAIIAVTALSVGFQLWLGLY